MEKIDIAIIGSGVIGLAVARSLASPDKDIMVIDRNDSFGRETSSRNSEVIHAGLYYPKGSLKAETCIRGRQLLYSLCAEHGIPHKKLGKILVATEDAEIKKLESIYTNATDCGVENLRLIDESEVKELEPGVSAKAGLFSSETGIIDSHALMKFLYHDAIHKGVDFAFEVEVTGIEKHSSGYQVAVKEPQGDSFSFQTKVVINAGGLSSDRIAEMAGVDIDKYGYRLHYCKGQYFRLRNPKKFSVTRPIYPPPTNIDLGIHVTPDLAGELRLGPDANYVDEIDYDVDDAAKGDFYSSVRRFLPALSEDDLIPDTSGIRPKLQMPDEAFRDFVISEESDKGLANFVNLVGIESPGLTACLAIAEKVKELTRSH